MRTVEVDECVASVETLAAVADLTPAAAGTVSGVAVWTGHGSKAAVFLTPPTEVRPGAKVAIRVQFNAGCVRVAVEGGGRMDCDGAFVAIVRARQQATAAADNLGEQLMDGLGRSPVEMARALDRAVGIGCQASALGVGPEDASRLVTLLNNCYHGAPR